MNFSDWPTWAHKKAQEETDAALAARLESAKPFEVVMVRDIAQALRVSTEIQARKKPGPKPKVK
jgi:hypothetical protein